MNYFVSELKKENEICEEELNCQSSSTVYLKIIVWIKCLCNSILRNQLMELDKRRKIHFSTLFLKLAQIAAWKPHHNKK